MSKTTYQRRLKKRAEKLGELFTTFPEQFQLAWARLFDEWVGEVRHRARAQQRDQADQAIPAIYGVLDHARRLAYEIKAQTDPKVAQSLRHLEHLCASAVASYADARLYSFHEDCTARVSRSWAQSR